jgi:Ca2+-binding EF-hand superfamily protein
MNKFAQALLMATALVLLPGSAAFAVDNAAALKALDPDDDGTIDLKEADDGALKVFKEINPDGTLDAKELEGRLTEAELKAADPDNDGTLDEKEYLAVVKQKFEAANPDNDGTVDLKELESPAGQELLKLIYK